MASTEKPGDQTPGTSEVSEAEVRGMKVDELRDKAEQLGIEGAGDMRKDELAGSVLSALRAGADDRARPAEGGGVRTGPETSRSVSYAQEITSVDEKPERPGRSLVTTNHDVIRHWAERRGARPATVPGTEHGDHLGVLRFDFPGYGGDDLRHVGWDEWFGTFDTRRLNFVYQEERKDGTQSNFFRLESPDREDA